MAHEGVAFCRQLLLSVPYCKYSSLIYCGPALCFLFVLFASATYFGCHRLYSFVCVGIDVCFVLRAILCLGFVLVRLVYWNYAAAQGCRKMLILFAKRAFLYVEPCFFWNFLTLSIKIVQSWASATGTWQQLFYNNKKWKNVEYPPVVICIPVDSLNRLK